MKNLLQKAEVLRKSSPWRAVTRRGAARSLTGLSAGSGQKLFVLQRASDSTYLSLGPGIRVSICDKVDFGVGTAFSLTSDNFADELIRSEFRFRY